MLRIIWRKKFELGQGFGLYWKFITTNERKMSAFTHYLNPLTGEYEWKIQNEDYDYHHEVARSAYADMLHDQERNEKYLNGLKISIRTLKEQGKQIHVLDIGTGTGLLSMMALSLGADFVTACESFLPMSECAKNTFKANKFEDKLHLVSKRSTELEVGKDKDMPTRANLLVAEVFDTELIGEGAIETFMHAKEHLLTDDAVIVPSAATVYAQVVESETLLRWNKMLPVIWNNPVTGIEKTLVSIPTEVRSCPGCAAIHDIQLSQISTHLFNPISEPIPVFLFDWSGRRIPLEGRRTTNNKFISLADGKCGALLFWWELQMDPFGEVILSCAPEWHHPLAKGKINGENGRIPWRDHWMQAIYYFPFTLDTRRGEELCLNGYHDEYSLWFSLESSLRKTLSYGRPVCECGLHLISSRSRLGQLNDPRRRKLYLRVLEETIAGESVCLFLGNFNYLAIAAANLGAAHVYVHETNPTSVSLLQKFIKENKVENKVSILTAKLSETPLEQLSAGKATVVFGEPNFTVSMLPWHSLQFLYLVESGRHLCSPNPRLLPHRMVIQAIPVSFRDLWKIRAPLNVCCGFDISYLNEIIEKAHDETNDYVEPQPLWEYPSVALGPPQILLSLSLDQPISQELTSHSCQMPVNSNSGVLNGLALWTEWHFGDRFEDVLSTGPVDPVIVGKEVSWDMYTRQGIYLLKNHILKTPSDTVEVEATTTFNVTTATISFDFKVDSS